MSFQNDHNEFMQGSQGPTLAELNAPPASDLLDDLCFDDLMEDGSGGQHGRQQRWDQHGLGLDPMSVMLSANASDLPSASLGTFSSAAPHQLGFENADLILHAPTFPPQVPVRQPIQQVTLGSSVPSAASVEIGGHRYIFATSGGSVSGAGLSGVHQDRVHIPKATAVNSSHLATLLAAPLGNSISVKPVVGQNVALSSSVPSSCGFVFSPAITTTGANPVVVTQSQPQQPQQMFQHMQQPSVVIQHQQEQIQKHQMEQLNILASNLAGAPSKPSNLVVSPQQPNLQAQVSYHIILLNFRNFSVLSFTTQFRRI
jgi:hypothetical protein